MKNKLRWMILVVPVTLMVAASCATPPDFDPQQAQAGANILLLLVSAIAGFLTLGANGGNGSTLCVFVFCQFYPG